MCGQNLKAKRGRSEPARSTGCQDVSTVLTESVIENYKSERSGHILYLEDFFFFCDSLEDSVRSSDYSGRLFFFFLVLANEVVVMVVRRIPCLTRAL